MLTGEEGLSSYLYKVTTNVRNFGIFLFNPSFTKRKRGGGGGEKGRSLKYDTIKKRALFAVQLKEGKEKGRGGAKLHANVVRGRETGGGWVLTDEDVTKGGGQAGGEQKNEKEKGKEGRKGRDRPDDTNNSEGGKNIVANRGAGNNN